MSEISPAREFLGKKLTSCVRLGIRLFCWRVISEISPGRGFGREVDESFAGPIGHLDTLMDMFAKLDIENFSKKGHLCWVGLFPEF